jgi:DNA-binding NarL/FixJ family response regulator
VVDLGLPDGDGATLLAKLRAACPGCGLLALAATQAETDRAAAVAPGVPVLCKTSSLAAVLGAIRALAVGDRVPAS